MNPQDLLPAVDVGLVHEHLAIEAAGTQERRIEHFGPIRGAHDDHALARVEAVHLGQQLVQGLLALLVAAERTLHADLAERVELVDEHDAGRLRLRLLKEIANARGADADEHLDELGSAQAEEGDMGLAGHRPRQQRLAGARRSHQQHPFRNPSAEIRVLLGSPEELHDFLQLVLGFVDARDIREAHLDLVVGVNLGAAAREGHDAAFGAAHAPEEEAPDPDEDNQRDDPAKQLRQPAIGDLAGVLHLSRFELLGQLRIVHAGRGELLRLPGRRLLQGSPDQLLAHGDFRDLAVLQECLELAVRDWCCARGEPVHLGQTQQQDQREAVPQRGGGAGRHRPLALPIAAAGIEPWSWFRSHAESQGRRGQRGRRGRKGEKAASPSRHFCFVTHPAPPAYPANPAIALSYSTLASSAAFRMISPAGLASTSRCRLR